MHSHVGQVVRIRAKKCCSLVGKLQKVFRLLQGFIGELVDFEEGYPHVVEACLDVVNDVRT